LLLDCGGRKAPEGERFVSPAESFAEVGGF